MQNDFKNKVVVVTGSGSGIGKEIAMQFCERGATVVLNGRNEDRLMRTQKEFFEKGFDINYCVADTTNYHDCCWLTDYVIREYGKVDVIIANASISMNGRFEHTLPHYFKMVVDSNIYAVAMPLFSFLPHLKKSEGSFVMISSVAGIHGVPTASAYSTGKMALSALHQSLLAELAPENIHVGIVYVGFTENDADKKTLSPKGESVPVPPRIKFMQQSQSKVASQILKVVKHRKSKLVLSSTGKLMYFMSKLFPSLITLMAKRHVRQQLKEAL